MFDTQMEPPAKFHHQTASGDKAVYLSAAFAGDSGAFEALTEPCRRGQRRKHSLLTRREKWNM
jgi:hypothetical protein